MRNTRRLCLLCGLRSFGRSPLIPNIPVREDHIQMAEGEGRKEERDGGEGEEGERGIWGPIKILVGW